MIEPNYQTIPPSAHVDLEVLQQRANSRRHRHRQAVQSFTSIRGSIKPLFVSPIQTIHRLPKRYILHTVVALVVPVALGLSQLPTRPLLQPEAPVVVTSDSPLGLGPLNLSEDHSHGVKIGDPPLPQDSIPVPLSLTSRSEALAPVVVPAHTAAGGTVKLRNGPGLDYDEVSRLDGSMPLEVIGRYGEWLQVRGEDSKQTYWVARELMDIQQSAVYTLFEVQEKDIPPPPPPKVAEVRDSGLNLRDGPGTNYVGMTKLESGQTLSLVEQYKDWFHVATDDLDGWVNAEYLNIAPGVVERVPVTENIPDPNPPLAGLINANGVNLRQGPGTAYGKSGSLDAGGQVNLLARYQDWFKVETGYGAKVWVFGDLLDIAPMARRRVPYTDDIPALPAPVVASRPGAPYAPGAAYGPGAAGAAPGVAGPGAVGAAPGAPSAPGAVGAAPGVPAGPGAAGAAPGAPGGPGAAGAAPGAPAPAPAAVSVAASGDVAGFALQFVGYPYVYGGASPGGFDCSGFTSYVYSQYGVYLPHNAAAQFSTAYGVSIGNTGNLAPGDLVFFAGTAGPGISHVALYIGGGRIVHAMMPGLGVQVSNLYESYWISHYAGSIRPYR